jgi:hypothetical protein
LLYIFHTLKTHIEEEMQGLTAVLTLSGVVALLALTIPLFKLWITKKGQYPRTQRRITPVKSGSARADYQPQGIELDLEATFIGK